MHPCGKLIPKLMRQLFVESSSQGTLDPEITPISTFGVVPYFSSRDLRRREETKGTNRDRCVVCELPSKEVKGQMMELVLVSTLESAFGHKVASLPLVPMTGLQCASLPVAVM